MQHFRSLSSSSKERKIRSRQKNVNERVALYTLFYTYIYSPLYTQKNTIKFLMKQFAYFISYHTTTTINYRRIAKFLLFFYDEPKYRFLDKFLLQFRF